ncbi:MAG: cytochrome P460 family protein [Alphaproteobacteria bacterium]
MILRIFCVRIVTGAALLAAALTGSPPGAGPAVAQSDVSPQKPSRHFRVERPAGLSGADALTIYNRILDDMVAGYRLSGLAFVERYRTWRRYNTVPYRSAQHGERFVNNYNNDAAKSYRLFEASGEMPAGSILVKDSFAVTKRGDVFSGPLFVMEKMPQGFNPVSGDWRYTMIMPDGSLFGVTNAEGSDRVEFCVTCHKMAGEQTDHLFYIPERYRVRFLN